MELIQHFHNIFMREYFHFVKMHLASPSAERHLEDPRPPFSKLLLYSRGFSSYNTIYCMRFLVIYWETLQFAQAKGILQSVGMNGEIKHDTYCTVSRCPFTNPKREGIRDKCWWCASKSTHSSCTSNKELERPTLFSTVDRTFSASIHNEMRFAKKSRGSLYWSKHVFH